MAGNSYRDEPLSLIHPSSSPITVPEEESFLVVNDHGSQIGSGSFQNEGFLGGDGNSDAEFGFARPDFRQSPLVGTTEMYDRHVFLCYKNPQVWPPRIEAAEFDRLPRLLSAALAARKGDMKRETRLTICEGHDGTEISNGDVLIFPDMIRYRRLTHFDVDTFVEEVLVKDGEWLPGTPEKLKGSYVFVCCHGSRDRRCGVCGPALVTRFREEIDSHGLRGKVSVSPCSHIGGHKYAGNVIIFGPNGHGEVSGHWYGYVTPDDVPLLLEQHIGKGEIIDYLWRGQMGLSEADQKRAQDIQVQLNGGTTVQRNTVEATQRSTQCCGANEKESTCCQNNQVFPEKVSKFGNNVNGKEENLGTGRKKTGKKQTSRINSGKGCCTTRKVCSMPTWSESWEREDTYAALAVVSAAVSITIAYNCYKQLR